METMNAYVVAEEKRGVPLVKPVAGLIAVLILAGCGTIKPEPLTQDEITARVNRDRAEMYRGQGVA